MEPTTQVTPPYFNNKRPFGTPSITVEEEEKIGSGLLGALSNAGSSLKGALGMTGGRRRRGSKRRSAHKKRRSAHKKRTNRNKRRTNRK